MFCCLRVVTFVKAVVDNALLGGFETIDSFEEVDIAGLCDLFVEISLAFVVVVLLLDDAKCEDNVVDTLPLLVEEDPTNDEYEAGIKVCVEGESDVLAI